MAVTSQRTITVDFTGDVTASVSRIADNTVSPGVSEVKTLASGNNTITAPDVDDIVVTGLTIIPPAANAIAMTLKGVNGDTGISLNLTGPTSIGLGASFVSLVINAGAEIDGVRLLWS